ncbi:MAG: DUF4347 domain-containing protein, partial [Granulosicoccus sp.]
MQIWRAVGSAMTLRRKQPRHSPPEFHLETLEQRILFSADAAFTALDVLPEPDTVVVMLQESQNDEAVSEESVQAVTLKAKELVVVDSALTDLQKLLDDLSRAGHESTQVVVLDAQSDALTQISEILAQQSGLTAVHVMSHVSSGVLELGDQRIETMDLLSRADELAQWRSALEPGADLLLYGFEVAADGTGRQFVDTMARLTGADVTASTDLTGSYLSQGALKDQPNSASYRSGVLHDALLTRQEILFLSSDVVDSQQLRRDIGSDIEVHILEPERDGVEFNNQFRDSSIYGNAGLGIDLGKDGVTGTGGTELPPKAGSFDSHAFTDQQLLDVVADDVLPARNSIQDSVAATASESDVTQHTLELVFIDGSIGNREQMIADLQNESALDDTRTLEIVVLDAKRDGIAQITAALIQYDGIDDMHIVSHGSDGQVQLGSTTLSLDSLDR